MHVSIYTISYRKNSNIKENIQQYLKNARKIGQILK